MIKISNDYLEVTISPVGAELQSIFNKKTGLEYMWSGDPKFWGKKSPVLFPVVGGLKNGSYEYNGVSYQLGRHGFAREMVFDLKSRTENSATFTLKTSDVTLKVYPFHFKFSIIYTVTDNILETTYFVENKGTKTMYFSVGAHPAFKVPLVDGDIFSDNYLAFNEEENAPIYPLVDTIVVATKPMPFFNGTKELPLTKALFYKDALIFKELKSTTISILSKNNKHGLAFSYKDFPYMGLWSAKDADFVCIEPWCGIADPENTTRLLQEKEGINKLRPNESLKRSWNVATF